MNIISVGPHLLEELKHAHRTSSPKLKEFSCFHSLFRALGKNVPSLEPDS
jgi:hypothetical protein